MPAVHLTFYPLVDAAMSSAFHKTIARATSGTGRTFSLKHRPDTRHHKPDLPTGLQCPTNFGLLHARWTTPAGQIQWATLVEIRKHTAIECSEIAQTISTSTENRVTQNWMALGVSTAKTTARWMSCVFLGCFPMVCHAASHLSNRPSCQVSAGRMPGSVLVYWRRWRSIISGDNLRGSFDPFSAFLLRDCCFYILCA